MSGPLRGLPPNACAFWKMGQILLIAAISAFVAGGLMLVLSILGFAYLRHAPAEAELRAGKGHGTAAQS